MILNCPACRTRYLVPDISIGAAGRQVRCASCRHSWFQEGPALAAGDDDTVAAMAAAMMPPPPGMPTAALPPTPDPMIEPKPASAGLSPVAPGDVAPVDEARPEGMPYRVPQIRVRRNPARLWTMLAIASAVLMLAGGATLLLFGPPSLATKFGFGPQAAVPLTIQVTGKPQRRTMESGNELLEVSGRIINPTDKTQPVPDIRAELRDKADRSVYSWTITRPANRLPPGGTAEFDSAAVDVPKGSSALRLSFADPSRR